jgi:outer membrane protein assembly factor BamB
MASIAPTSSPVDAAGDVVAGGTISDTGVIGGFTVLKLRGRSGKEQWRQVIQGPVRGESAVNALIVDATGDVIAAGLTTLSTIGPGITAFTVVKLDKSSGAEDWRYVITDSPTGRANAVAVDAVGDVIAGGAIPKAGPRPGFAVVKLDRASGGERWRYSAASSTAPGFADGVSKVAVDAAGNVVAVGAVTNPGTQADFTVIKLNSATGVELWNQTLNGTANGFDRANAVAVDAAGDVFASGFLANTATGSDFTVVKFDGRTGAERWRQVLPAPGGCCVGGAQTVDVDDAGDVVVAGWTLNPDASPNYFTIVKFDGFSGVERWRRIISTPSGCCQSGVSAVHAEGMS